MSCLCSLPLGQLLNALPPVPALAGLLPPWPPLLVPAITATLPGLAVHASVGLPTSALATAGLTAQLSVMASVTAAVQALFGIDLSAPLSAQAQAQLQAQLAPLIGSLNVNAGLLNAAVPRLPSLLELLQQLLSLLRLVDAVQASLGIDLRLPGAVTALQAHLDLPRPNLAVNATAQVSAAETLMTTLGYPPTPAGALAANASAQAIAGLTLGLPTITVNLHALSLLALLLALLAALLKLLKFDLCAPQGLAQLRATLAALPLAALAELRLPAPPALPAVAASAQASALAGLNLAGVLDARLGAAAQLVLLLQVLVNGPFLQLPPGSCGQPCPLALVAAVA